MENLFGDETLDKAAVKDNAKKREYPEPKSFEDAIAELEEVIRSLESGKTPLEETLMIYKKAKFLAEWCYRRLTSVRGELKKLGLDENGKFTLDDFPPLD